MSSRDVSETEQAVLAVLERQRKDYLTVPQLVKAAGAPLRKRLGLGTGMAGRAALERLAPYLGGRLRVYNKGVSSLIGKDLATQEIVLRQIQERPRSSLKRVAQRVPLAKAEFIAALNRLLEERAVVCSFDANYQPSLRAEGGGPVVPDDRAAFKAAYEAEGRGARYVRIHRVRQRLAWPRERFDRLLAELRGEYTIDLHGGDPSLMSETEIADSYIDENNLLHLTLTWRR